MRYFILVILFNFHYLNAQVDDQKVYSLDTINLHSKWISLKYKQLYDYNEAPELENISGFFALNLYKDNIDKQIWISPEKQCIQMNSELNLIFEGQKSIAIKWDKISGGCKWIGMGFGWDNWKPKDISQIIDSAAIEINFVSPESDLNNLPLAFALEDYSGTQTFVGFKKEYLANKLILSKKWNKIIIPLKDFPYDSNQTDIGNIKQFIIQFEADGSIVIDNVHIITLNPTKK